MRRRVSSGALAILIAVLGTSLPLGASASASMKSAKGALIVATYGEGSGGTSPGRVGKAERPREPIRSESIEVSKNGERIWAVAPTSSRTRIRLRPGDYEVRTSCGRTKAVVRPHRTTTVSVYCHRK